PDGGKTGRAATWLYQTLKGACPTHGDGILFSFGALRATREISRCLRWLAGAPHQRSLRFAVARHESVRRCRLVPAGFCRGTDYAVEDRSVAHQTAHAGGS